MAAGALDRRAQFRRATVGDDGFGQTEAWADHGAVVWASRRDVSDAEKAGAGQVNATVMSRFRVRRSAFTAGLTAKDRFVCDGREWSITGLKETDRPGLIEITATAGND